MWVIRDSTQKKLLSKTDTFQQHTQVQEDLTSVYPVYSRFKVVTDKEGKWNMRKHLVISQTLFLFIYFFSSTSLQGSRGRAGQVRGSPGTPLVEQNCQVPGFWKPREGQCPGPFGPSPGPTPLLLGLR